MPEEQKQRKSVEVSLERIALAQTGACGRASTCHSVMATLVWPRFSVAERLAVKEVTLGHGKAAEFQGVPWHRRILFKEAVEGNFGVVVAVTRDISRKQLDEFLRFIGSRVMKTVADEAEGAAGGLLAGGLLSLPLEYVGRSLDREPDASALVIARGEASLCADGWARGRSIPLRLELKAPATVLGGPLPRRGGRGAVRRRELIEAGASNGFVELSFLVR